MLLVLRLHGPIEKFFGLHNPSESANVAVLCAAGGGIITLTAIAILFASERKRDRKYRLSQSAAQALRSSTLWVHQREAIVNRLGSTAMGWLF
jgi:hypothetical protein